MVTPATGCRVWTDTTHTVCKAGGCAACHAASTAVTPPVSDNILEGITRRTIMVLLKDELGIDVVERPVDRTELFLADEVFFSGTGVQLSAVTKIDHRQVGTGKMGPVVRQLREIFFNVVRGRVVKYRHWCTPVYHRGGNGSSPKHLEVGATARKKR